MNNDLSFSALLFAMDPDEEYTFTCYNLTVNYNDSYHKMEVLGTIYNYSDSKTSWQDQNEHLPGPRTDIVSFMSTRGEGSAGRFDSTRAVRMIPLLGILSP